jgi:hypothetical protein
VPNVLQIPVQDGVASVVWPGRPTPGVNSLLLINQDLNNTVYVGNDSTISATTANTIPIGPNGSISVDPASAWYVVGAAAGIQSLIMIPNGMAYFQALTQGLGNLVIPSVQSPNFVTEVSGWQIAKDGSAEFNDLTIRGTFYGTNFEINSDGAFFYDGTPALGSLMFAITNPMAGGTDMYGNTYAPGGVSIIALTGLLNVMSLQDTSGNTLMSIDNAGNITGQTVTANDDVILDGASLTADLNSLASGLTNYGYIAANPWPSSPLSAAVTALFELDQVVTGGRIYEFVLNPTTIRCNTAGATVALELRYTSDGSTPTTSSALATYVGKVLSAANSGDDHPGLRVPFFPTVNGTYRFLVCGLASAGTWYFTQDPFIRCEINDLGANDNGQSSNNITVLGTGSGGGNSKQTYTKTYNALHTYSYEGSTGHQPNTLLQTDGNAQQGGDYANTYNGDSYSWILWPSSIASDLAGATVNWVKLKLSNTHTWYNSGGTVQVGHTTTSTFPNTTTQPASIPDQVNQNFGEGQTLTFYVDSNGTTWGAAFQSGGARSTLMAANTSDLHYYMLFKGATNPQLIINYTV